MFGPQEKSFALLVLRTVVSMRRQWLRNANIHVRCDNSFAIHIKSTRKSRKTYT